MPRCYRILWSCTSTISARSSRYSWEPMGASATRSFRSIGQSPETGSLFSSGVALGSWGSRWPPAAHQPPMILTTSMSPSSSWSVSIVVPGWAAVPHSFFGIVFRVTGLFAFPRATAALFLSGQPSSPSTRAARYRNPPVLGVRTRGACSPSTARIEMWPSNTFEDGRRPAGGRQEGAWKIRSLKKPS